MHLMPPSPPETLDSRMIAMGATIKSGHYNIEVVAEASTS